MAIELYFVRHGESLDNVAGVTYDEMKVDEEGFIDNPLSELGERQARAAADWFAARGIRPDAVFSSGLARSSLTAEPIAERYGLEIEVLRELREVHVERDTLSGLRVENALSRSLYRIPGGKKLRDRIVDAGMMVAFNAWSRFGLPGFESAERLKARAGFCLDTLAAWPVRRVIAVAHNFLIGALLLELIDRYPPNYLRAAPHLGFMANCSVSCVVAHPPRFRLRYAARETNDFS